MTEGEFYNRVRKLHLLITLLESRASRSNINALVADLVAEFGFSLEAAELNPERVIDEACAELRTLLYPGRVTADLEEERAAADMLRERKVIGPGDV
jgi:hypothetical protein